MPLTVLGASEAIKNGLSAVCATCNKYWKAREQGIPGDRCLAVEGCGSPLRGDDFHEYEGPMKDFTRWCFVCGLEARYVVRARKVIAAPTKPIGVCATHISFFRSLERPTSEMPEALSPGAQAALDKKTLAQEMDDYENGKK